MVGKTKIQQSRLAPSQVQRLDTDIANMMAESLNFWLIKFVEELCKENGERYPPRSLYSIVCGIQRFLEYANVPTICCVSCCVDN